MIDLHCHLSGSTDLVVLYELLRESGYKIPARDYWEFADNMLMKKENVSNLDEYLKILHTIDELQSYPLAIERSVYNSFVSAYLAGCTHLELRFNPAKRSQNGKIDLDTIIISARAGMERAKMTFDIDGGLILCLGRDMSIDANRAVFKKAHRYHNKGVIGVDIAGPYIQDEPAKFYELNGFASMYAAAFDKGMITTVHVGETEHPNVREEMLYVFEKLSPQRIGHGIQVFKYPELIQMAREKGFIFEFCPTSNFTTGIFKSPDAFLETVKDFNVHQLSHVVCTDATYLLQTNIEKENKLYNDALNSFAWSDEDHARGLGPVNMEDNTSLT